MMKLIQILVVASSLAISAAAQTGDAATPSKPKQQDQSQTSTDSQKKSSAKSNAATKKTSDSSAQGGKIQIIPVGPPAGKKPPATSTSSKTPMATGKPTPSTASGSSATAQKNQVTTTTGKTTPAAGTPSSTGAMGKTAASGKPGTQPATQSKQPTPVIPLGAASKQTTGKQAHPNEAVSQPPAGKQPPAKQAATQAKGTNKNPPIMVKKPEPKIMLKKPSKEELVAASKVSSRISSGGRRDPFVSPIRTVTPQTPSGPNCSTGKKCLAINELVVQGTAKDTDGKMMAIVASSTHRAYFLRENDQVFNGTVQKITSDSVIFRESVVDSLGRQSTHEIVKRINPS